MMQSVIESYAPRDPNYREVVATIFEKASFVQAIGITLEELGPGWCESRLFLRDMHLQQDGVAHAGLLATIADHTAGGAGATLLAPGQGILSIEFKINMLRPAKGEALLCRAEVLKAGRTVTVAESVVYALDGETRRLVAKATVTLAVLADGVRV